MITINIDKPSEHPVAKLFNVNTPINYDGIQSIKEALDSKDTNLIKAILAHQCKQAIDSVINDDILFSSDENPRVATFINMYLDKLKKNHIRTLAIFIEGEDIPILVAVNSDNAVIEVANDAMSIAEAQDWVDSPEV